MDENYKEVYFSQYCTSCKNAVKTEDEEPCNDCLANPMNVDSHKPTHWEEKA
jgi:hypothetical protein